MKDLLAAIWGMQFKGGSANMDVLVSELYECSRDFLEEKLDSLTAKGLINKQKEGYVLTAAGREKIRIVVCGGVFDIVHPGHAFILNEAKKEGDVLIVILARDSTVEKRKRIPIVPENQRKEMVSNLKSVDIAVLGHEGDPLEIIEEIKPDVIVLGPDQHHREEKIKAEMEKRQINLRVKRINEYKECELNSTKTILEKIIERNYPKP